MDKEVNSKIVLDILKVLYRIRGSMLGDIKEQVKGLDMGRSEVIILLRLYEDKNRCMSSLCLDTDLKSGSLTTVIDKMVRKGYAQRENDSFDRRKIMVALTAKGCKIASKINEYLENQAVERISKLNDREKKEFFRAIEVLNQTLKHFEEN